MSTPNAGVVSNFLAWKPLVSTPLFLLAAALMVLLSGCDSTQHDGYESNIRYPLRLDPVVESLPTVPAERPRDGQPMDELVRQLPALGGKILEPNSIPEARKQQLAAALDHLFGTPAEPVVLTAPATASTALALEPETLRRGSSLYRLRCADCHGLPGHGRGPTAANIQPRPRDFRSGLFKCSSLSTNGKPHQAEMQRVLRRGVPGTPMPIFDLLPDADIRALTGYTIHLSIRGEVELRVLRRLLNDEDPVDNVAQAVATAADSVLAAWMAAQVAPAKPDSYLTALEDADAIRRGHGLFVNASGGASCMSCHENYGRKEVLRYDEWGQPNRVANLTEPLYRWGGEPADLAQRIRHGIRGANMPSNPALTDSEVRDLVAFLLALPYPARLPEDVRRIVDSKSP